MLGAAGVVIPGLLTKAGILNVPDWWVAGEVAIKDSGIPFWALVMVQAILMGWAEIARIQDYKKPGSQGDGSFFGVTDGFTPVSNGYPGGLFDPMGMGKGDGLKTAQQKEIKNGRLAMLACVGFVAQHAATGKGPIDNLFDHMASPGMVCLLHICTALECPHCNLTCATSRYGSSVLCAGELRYQRRVSAPPSYPISSSRSIAHVGISDSVMLLVEWG